MINPIFGDFIAGAGEIYASAGYNMVLNVVQDSDEEAAYRAMANKRSVDGVIVHGPRLHDPRIALLQDIGLPFLVHGRAPDAAIDYPWMDMNNKSAFKRATEFLLDLGHRRIALLNGLESMNFAVRRRAGYEAALTERGLEPDLRIMRQAEMMEPYGYESAMELLQGPEPVTAFLVSSIISAIGVQRAVQELGLKLGSDVSLITHDDQLSFFQNSGKVPLFTSTRSSVRLAGKRCAEMLLDIIRDPDTPNTHDLWEAELTIGDSTGPAIR